VAVVSRLSIDRLRRAATERAAYAGTWLPEPIAGGDLASAGHRAELASAAGRVRLRLRRDGTRVERKWKDITTQRIAWATGEPAIVTEVGGRVFANRVLNPDKLRHVAAALPG
jgi:hypothetical protein